MNILIYYFSGTGNTQKVAQLYSAAFESKGASVTLCELPDAMDGLRGADAAKFMDGFDLIGIGYPIHSFNAPKIILKLCKLFPKRNKRDIKRMFVFKTSGEPVRMSDVSSLKMRSMLKRRGYDVQNEYQYVMPYNIIFRHSDGMVYKMWETAKSLVPVDVNEIIDGKRVLPRKMFMGGVLAWVLRIEHGGAHIIGKFYKVNDRCVKCGMCKRACPVDNITIKKNGKIKFGGKCIMCMRCVFFCPTSAIDMRLLRGWKVNGAYSFEKPLTETSGGKHDKYCAKAYDRYFTNAQNKIAKAQDLLL